MAAQALPRLPLSQASDNTWLEDSHLELAHGVPSQKRIYAWP